MIDYERKYGQENVKNKEGSMKRGLLLIAVCSQLSTMVSGSCDFQYTIFNDGPFANMYVSTNRNINTTQFVSLDILENSPNVKKVKKGRKSERLQGRTIFIYTPVTDSRGKDDQSGRFEQRWMVQALMCDKTADQSGMPVLPVDIKYSDIVHNILDKRKFAIKKVQMNNARAEHSIETQQPSQPSYWVAPGGRSIIIP